MSKIIPLKIVSIRLADEARAAEIVRVEYGLEGQYFSVIAADGDIEVRLPLIAERGQGSMHLAAGASGASSVVWNVERTTVEAFIADLNARFGKSDDFVSTLAATKLGSVLIYVRGSKLPRPQTDGHDGAEVFDRTPTGAALTPVTPTRARR
jgi:hypothetical protein